MFKEVANEYFGALALERCAAFVLLMHKSPNCMTSVEKVANGVDARFSRSAGDEVFTLLHGEYSKVKEHTLLAPISRIRRYQFQKVAQ
ncbi:hypothetical protein TMM008_44760 [Pseudomonas sp. 008]|nr:hypothetical protein TMM008_44760 [Pseudomonas sp. 008]